MSFSADFRAFAADLVLTHGRMLTHYNVSGSANPDYLREMRAIESDCDLAPLGRGPLEPELPPASSALYDDDKYSGLKDEARAERRELARSSYYEELGRDLR